MAGPIDKDAMELARSYAMIVGLAAQARGCDEEQVMQEVRPALRDMYEFARGPGSRGFVRRSRINP